MLVAVATACGSDGSSAPGTPATSTTAATVTSVMPVLASSTTSSSIRPTTAASRPSVTTSPSTTVVAGRSVALGATFSAAVGETVVVAGEGLSVTYSALVSDNRCPPGVQCIVAGNAAIAVSVAKAAMPTAGLTLNTDEAPRSARYGSYSVELVQLGFGRAPTSRLRVS